MMPTLKKKKTLVEVQGCASIVFFTDDLYSTSSAHNLKCSINSTKQQNCPIYSNYFCLAGKFSDANIFAL